MKALARVEMVAAWLAVMWAAAPHTHVRSVSLAVVVPLLVVLVGAVLLALERLGAGVIGIVLTVTAVWMFVAATWGVLGGIVLLVSSVAALASG